MAVTAPSKPAGPGPLVPPEEKFWKRYSPHGEAPLSVAGSFAAHAICVGGMIVAAVYLASLFVKPPGNIGVTPVRIEMPGGSKGNGAAGGPAGAGALVENPGEAPVDLPPE